jgi:hypothetical protein
VAKYRAKEIVNAVQWTGDNLEEMKELLRDVVDGDEDGPYVYADEIEPIFLKSLGYRPGYMILKTEMDEFDPGTWVVVFDNNEIEGFSNNQFNKRFEKDA